MGNAESKRAVAAARELKRQRDREAVKSDQLERFHELYDGECPVTPKRLEVAAQTSPGSLCALGFARGQGLFGWKAGDWKGALACYRAAAEKNHPAAFSLLSSCYRNGLGVKVDLAESDRLQQRSADLGDAREMFNVALAHANGTRRPQNWTEAARWYRRGADSGNAGCIVNLGMLYEKGTGVAQSWPDALRLYKDAASLDRSPKEAAVAAVNLANCYTQGWGTDLDLPEAARWLERAVFLGNAEAALDLGVRYEDGAGVVRNMERAFELYKRSAILGNPFAAFNVANCLRNGWGCDCNFDAAVRMYAYAAQVGVRPASEELEKLKAGAEIGAALRKSGAERPQVLAGVPDGALPSLDDADLKQLKRDLKLIQSLGTAGIFRGAKGTFVDELMQTVYAITPLSAAASSGDLGGVTRLILRDSSDPNQTDARGWTPIHHAAVSGHVHIVKYLVTCCGAKTDLRNHHGFTAVFLACKAGSEELARFLALEHGADVAGSHPQKWEAIRAAANHNCVGLMQLLVTDCGADVCAINSVGSTDRTALMQAAEGGHIDVVKYLIQSEAAVDVRDTKGSTPLSLAATYNRVDVVQYLVTECAAEDHEAFVVAAAKGYLDVVKILAPQYDINGVGDDGETAVIRAAASGHTETVRFLVTECGANVNDSGISGRCPLHVAAMGGHIETARLLAKDLRADVNTEDDNHHTPTTAAFRSNHRALVEMLVRECGGEPASLLSLNPEIGPARASIVTTISNVVIRFEEVLIEAGVQLVNNVEYVQTAQSMVMQCYNECYMAMLRDDQDLQEAIHLFATLKSHSPVCVMRAMLIASLAVLPTESLNRHSPNGLVIDLDAAHQSLQAAMSERLERLVDWGCFSSNRPCTHPPVQVLRDDWRAKRCPKVTLFKKLTPDIAQGVGAAEMAMRPPSVDNEVPPPYSPPLTPSIASGAARVTPSVTAFPAIEFQSHCAGALEVDWGAEQRPPSADPHPTATATLTPHLQPSQGPPQYQPRDGPCDPPTVGPPEHDSGLATHPASVPVMQNPSPPTMHQALQQPLSQTFSQLSSMALPRQGPSAPPTSAPTMAQALRQPVSHTLAQACSLPTSVMVESWLCNPDGSPLSLDSAAPQRATVTVTQDETVHELVTRLCSPVSTSDGFRIHGQVLSAQPSETQPVLEPCFFQTTPIHAMVNHANPRLILRVAVPVP